MSAQRTFGQRLLIRVASLGPLGHLPASGTVTVAIVGVPFYYVMASWPIGWRLAFALAFVAASVWIHQVGDRLLQTEDSRALVWDELAGFFIAVVFLERFTWPAAGLAFFTERAFDILKIPPANWVERRLPGGWGVVGDDVVAGLYTCACLAVVARAWPAALGFPG